MLAALLFGNFVIGTGIMVVPGTLNDIAASLRISVSVAGQLVSAAALVVSLGAPLFASVVGKWDRRILLALSMVWYSIFHLACALMPGFGGLMLVRVLSIVSAAIFTPQAAACVGLLVPPERRGAAIAMIFLGWSLASVLGMPVAALIGNTLGWRWAFVVVALLALASAGWIWQAMPRGIRPAPLSLQTWAQTFRSRPIMLCILVTTLYSAGQFVLFAYLAPYYRQVADVGPGQLSLLFLWFGIFGVAGSMLLTRYIDRIGAARAVLIAVASMTVSLAFWPLATGFVSAALIAIPWALGCFSSNSAQQARLVGLAPALAAGSVALNTSAMYAGQAIGAASGGWLIAHDGMRQLSWYGCCALVAAMVVSWAASVAARKTRTSSR